MLPDHSLRWGGGCSSRLLCYAHAILKLQEEKRLGENLPTPLIVGVGTVKPIESALLLKLSWAVVSRHGRVRPYLLSNARIPSHRTRTCLNLLLFSLLSFKTSWD